MERTYKLDRCLQFPDELNLEIEIRFDVYVAYSTVEKDVCALRDSVSIINRPNTYVHCGMRENCGKLQGIVSKQS